MKVFQLIYFLIVFSLCHPRELYAGAEHCPREAIHCIFNASNSPPKWIKVIMLPRNLRMVLCLGNQEVVYLEKDDIEQDGLSAGSQLAWLVSQCLNKDCLENQFLARDQFVLLSTAGKYGANPAYYGFSLDPSYGENC